MKTIAPKEDTSTSSSVYPQSSIDCSRRGLLKLWIQVHVISTSAVNSSKSLSQRLVSCQLTFNRLDILKFDRSPWLFSAPTKRVWGHAILDREISTGPSTHGHVAELVEWNCSFGDQAYTGEKLIFGKGCTKYANSHLRTNHRTMVSKSTPEL